MNCIRHKMTELVDGVCPECGWSCSSTSESKVEEEVKPVIRKKRNK